MSQVVLERGRVQRLFREQEDDSLISVSGHRKVCAGDAYTRVCFSVYVRVSARMHGAPCSSGSGSVRRPRLPKYRFFIARQENFQ